MREGLHPSGLRPGSCGGVLKNMPRLNSVIALGFGILSACPDQRTDGIEGLDRQIETMREHARLKVFDECAKGDTYYVLDADHNNLPDSMDGKDVFCSESDGLMGGNFHTQFTERIAPTHQKKKEEYNLKKITVTETESEKHLSVMDLLEQNGVFTSREDRDFAEAYMRYQVDLSVSHSMLEPNQLREGTRVQMENGVVTYRWNLENGALVEGSFVLFPWEVQDFMIPSELPQGENPEIVNSLVKIGPFH